MGHNMRTRIFWPVLAVILFLAAGVWISFAATSEWYAAYTAEKYTAEMLSMVEQGRTELSREAERLKGREEAREYSKELLQYVKNHVKSGETEGKLLVFNSKLRQTYPQTPEEGTVPDQLRQICASILEEKPGSRAWRKLETWTGNPGISVCWRWTQSIIFGQNILWRRHRCRICP